MNNNMFEIVIGDKTYSSQEFRTLCKYFDVTLSIYSDGMLDELVNQWNFTMPIGQRATLLFDGEPSKGFKRSSEPRRGKRSVNTSKTGALYVNK